MVGIKNIPESDRPRERLIEKGCSNLSNEELLAIVLGSGNKNSSVKDIAINILSTIENITDLKKISYQGLLNIEGIGKAKACIILAIVELSKRLNQNILTLNEVIFNSPEIIFEYFKSLLETEMQECFFCIYLDSKKKIITNKLLFKGTLDRSLVHPREIFKEACMVSASSIICVHNHPTGNVKPSNEDIFLTNALKEIGQIMGITLNDHIIIGKDSYYSFFENGELWKK